MSDRWWSTPTGFFDHYKDSLKVEDGDTGLTRFGKAIGTVGYYANPLPWAAKATDWLVAPHYDGGNYPEFDPDNNVSILPETNRPYTLPNMRTEYHQPGVSGKVMDSLMTPTTLSSEVLGYYNQAAQRRSAALDALTGQYDGLLGNLRGSYQFKETGAEKKALAKVLETYRHEAKAAHKNVNRSYGAAIDGITQGIHQAKADRSADTAAVQAIWEDAAANAAAANEYAGGQFGGTDANADAAVGNMASAGAQAVTSARASGTDAINSAKADRRTAKAAKAAHHTEVGNDRMYLADTATAQHSAQVADRINADRRAYQDAYQALMLQKIQALASIQSEGRQAQLAKAEAAASQYASGSAANQSVRADIAMQRLEGRQQVALDRLQQDKNRKASLLWTAYQAHPDDPELQRRVQAAAMDNQWLADNLAAAAGPDLS